MRNAALAAIGSAQFAPIPYSRGEALLESERLYNLGYPIRGGGAAADEKEAKDFDDIFKPKTDDFPVLKKGLQFLKFDEKNAEELYNLIGGTITAVAGIVSVVGAAIAVADIMKSLGLLGPKEDANDILLRQIGQRVEQIYGYLGAQSRRGLHAQAVGWRIAATKARNSMNNAMTSRSPGNLRTLIDRAAELDTAILTMLDPGGAKIAFLRAVYGYPLPNAAHWIDVAAWPFMTLASGEGIAFHDPTQELQAEIWDAGHYLDVLLGAIRDRLAIALAIEPAFRSTGYDRDQISDIATGLVAFTAAWRGALIVANPAVGINPGGNLQNPLFPDSAPSGVVIGAVDPVTGISTVDAQWRGFFAEYTRHYIPGDAWGGVYDEARATDPKAAIAAALPLHAAMVDHVVEACGLKQFEKLSYHVRMVASAPAGSDFVRLPDAAFKLLAPIESGGSEVVDLGERLKVFATDKDKTYAGQRFFQKTEKAFTFRMARRAEESRIQLGYRLSIGGHAILLCPFSTSPPEGVTALPFPSGTIQETLQIPIAVYDCYQSRHLSSAEEDQFESDGVIRAYTPYGTTCERLFLNKRDGAARLQVTVQFNPLAGAIQQGYVGEAVVTVRNLDERMYQNAFILPVVVWETHVAGGAGDPPYEALADTMTVQVAPSYVVLGSEFFADFRDARARMTRTIKGINDKYAMQDLMPGLPDPDPVWRVARPAVEVENGAAFVEAALRRRPDLVGPEIERFRFPAVGRVQT